ncbi:uncharacterized protein AC631_04696 [Debaryomyces fabryi]|uniref:Uncharacterized protein n=1 Tax=Debaryomyces fabryi TaxID=58627 RepID=A0A0V1PTQ6_9ASCO|nr:uncharacterized protein AC631_04696 [Debaryomyces fabryi]KRZ99538.1 hypothetical protein AC631_04696 [Debaryomyces fabryi]CUM45542.1 unnamed protein product [Debaryomyces fabryi]
MIYDRSQDSEISHSSLFDSSSSTLGISEKIELQDFNLHDCLPEADNTDKREISLSPSLSLRDYENTVNSSLMGQFSNSNDGFHPEEEAIGSFSLRTRTKNFAKYVWKMFFISILLQLFLTYSYTMFVPQFSLQFRDDSPEARRLLSSISEGLKMISYLAKDLSVTLNDNNNILNDINYIDTIDTFSNNYIYKFNAIQYCRYSTANATTECVSTNGLDIFTSLVTDIGLQLGNVSKAEDPSKLANSLVTTYSNLVDSLDEMNNSKKNRTFALAEIDLTTIKIAHSLKKSQNYGKTMSLLSSPVNFMHPIVWMTLGLSCFTLSGTSKFSTFNQRNSFCYSIIIMVFLVICFGITFFNWATTGWYFYRISSQMNKVNIARLNFGSGFFILTSCVCLYVVLLYQLRQVLRSKN